MKEKENGYVKRTQKDYSMSFKLSVVKEVETTDIGLCAIARKYGIQSESMSESLNTEGALRALKMAQASRVYKDEPLIHHSDRGIQYCSDSYQDKLAKYGITTSMTESYDPYANAVAERINGILKQEFLLEEINLPLKDMKLVVRDAINTYNRVRPHYSCGYLTPCQMHDQREVKVKTYKIEDHCSPRVAMIF